MALSILTFLLVTLAVFAIFRLLPSDPSRVLLGVYASGELSDQVRARLELDRPFYEQYWRYLQRVFRGDFGLSYFSGAPVSRLILSRLPQTIQLALASIPFALCAVLFGAWTVRHDAGWTRFLERGSVVLAAIPVFLIAVLFSYVIGYVLGILPANGYRSGPESFRYLLLPAASISVYPCCLLFRLTREQFRDVLSQRFILAVRSRGVPEGTVFYKYVLKSASIPLVTGLTSVVGFYLGGAFFVEAVFSWPGLGLLLLDAINRYDYPVIVAMVLLASTVFIVVSLVTDVLSSLLDPRVSH
jgi:peptide/nickel transport system permease protein